MFWISTISAIISSNDKILHFTAHLNEQQQLLWKMTVCWEGFPVCCHTFQGYINDGCWRRNLLMTSLRCWWPINIQKLTNITEDHQHCLLVWFCHRHLKLVTIKNLSTYRCHQHHCPPLAACYEKFSKIKTGLHTEQKTMKYLARP